MSTTRVYTRNQIKNHVIIDRNFYKEARVRQIALAAAGMLKWVDHAKATFSVSTADRYLESLYWNPANPDRIEMGVLPDTLASLLEYGQDPRDLNSIFLRKAKLSKEGKAYKIIPIDDSSGDRSQTRAMQYVATGMPLSVSEADILYYVNYLENSKVAELAIKAKMSKFDRSRAAAHSFKPAGKFIVNKKSQKFRTITSPSSANTGNVTKPSDIWKHPGIRAALIGNQVSSWLELNRSRYIDPLFNREAGFPVS